MGNIQTLVIGIAMLGMQWCQIFPCMRANAPTEAKRTLDYIVAGTREHAGSMLCLASEEDRSLLYCDWNDFRTSGAHDAFLVVRVRPINGGLLDTVTMYWRDQAGGSLKIWDSVGDDPQRVADTIICIDICAYVAVADSHLYTYVCDDSSPQRQKLWKVLRKDKSI